MNDNTKAPYEWYSVLNWTASLFLWGLVANSAISKSPGGRIAFGIIWAVIGLIAVGVFKYFKRSTIKSREQLQIDSEKADKTVFYVCMVLGAMFIGQAFFFKSFGTLGDAAIYIALGFWVKSRSAIARWLLAVYAFVSAIFVTTQGLSAGGMPFIFFIIGLSIIINRKYQLSEQVADSLIPPKSDPSAKYTTNNLDSHSPSSNSGPIDDDRFFTQVAKELVSKQIDDGLWAKAFALQDGDEKKTKAQYIKLRVEQLARQHIAIEPMAQATDPVAVKISKPLMSSNVELIVLGIVVVGGWYFVSSLGTNTNTVSQTPLTTTNSSGAQLKSSSDRSSVADEQIVGAWDCRNSQNGYINTTLYYADHKFFDVKDNNNFTGGVGQWRLNDSDVLIKSYSEWESHDRIQWVIVGREMTLKSILGEGSLTFHCIKSAS